MIQSQFNHQLWSICFKGCSGETWVTPVYLESVYAALKSTDSENYIMTFACPHATSTIVEHCTNLSKWVSLHLYGMPILHAVQQRGAGLPVSENHNGY